MKKIRVGGVPEHFNLPWHLAEETGAFEKAGIDFEWIFYKGGTGAMTKALRENEADLCVLLTEGIVSDIYKGCPAKIISRYITSPLIWGIHTGVENSLSAHHEIYDKQYAISRIGSGSHLMAQVDAYYHNKEIQESQFTIIKNLDGALESLSKRETDVFYWEKFTTKPYVDRGILKRVGTYPTPWPCFVIAATDAILESEPGLVRDTLSVIYEFTRKFMENPGSPALVSERYDQKEEDVLEWFSATQWATSDELDPDVIEEVVKVLQKVGIIENGKSLPMDRLLMNLI